MTTVIWWIRRDLRLHDNPALAQALTGADCVIPVFVLDQRFKPSFAQGRFSFLIQSLKALRTDLQTLGSSLVLREGDPVHELSRLIVECGASKIYAEADYSPFTRRRDKAVASVLPLTLVHGLTIHPPGSVVKGDGTPYTIFTPFRNAWLSLPLDFHEITPPVHLQPHQDLSSIPLPDSHENPLFPAGEAAARLRLQEFLKTSVSNYALERDRMDLEGTSRLSPYIRFGQLSMRYVYAQGLHSAAFSKENSGISSWLNELIWREFFIHIMAAFPQVMRGAFRPNLRAVPWRDSSADLQAWQAGLTGYPLVDAGMRQLAQTGWMHNRARMITASFLAKHLLINWQSGEEWFMRHLLDGDPASNNGGWQWSAGTGTDAAPYFRIFNPVLQSRKFDPSGDYIRAWVPELANVPPNYIHEPWLMPMAVQSACGVRIGKDYPSPVVEHTAARARALAAYKTSA
ncbi:MAG: deoxyribodipyrimidine photo-lyase [Anaerolineae bacterium]|nr:deoxyribodipyrimidine photo-lyase [Anaerolineae bacterium]